MFTVAVSAIALVLAVGPQLQTSLQAAIDQSQPVVEDVTESETGEENPGQDTSPEPTVDEPADATATTMAVDTVPAASEPTLAVDAADTDVTPQPASGAVDPAQWPAILDAASAALTAANTATGKFIQTNADGTITTGTFALNRPGRMRFDYDDPTPILIVSNGTTVAMEDSELETIDRVPIGSTPLALILATDLNVDEDVEVLSIIQNEERVGVRVSDSSGELDGTLTMVFDKVSYDLLGWLATDGNLQTTVVDLLDVETNVRVDPRLFRLDDAEDEEDER
ncbi:MAG: outer membrane lipoprotein carrier protein LolA [Pseudomonadota bacterium]|nr:outer membrane lipoprotein carrier protein LolA [Pseudomonadota bacterium]